MSDPLPPTLVNPAEPGRASVVWDRDAMLMTVDIAYPAAPLDDSLRARIEAAVGIGPSARRLVLGDLDALLDELARPTSIELRRNPATWRADARLGMPDAESGHVCIQAELDQNGIGTLDVAVEVRYGAGTWAVTFADERPARWVQIADRVALGLSADDRWVALRVADVDV